MTAPAQPWPVPDRCGDHITFQPSEDSRTVLVWVGQSDHGSDVAHRSGTDPVVRWRTNRQDSSVTDVWTEPWRDWAGRTVAEREAAGLVT